MTPEALATLHASAFAPARGWSPAEFNAFRSDPASVLITAPHGFALARITLDEAELLSIATDPAVRRQGIARNLLTRMFDILAARNATQIFLEVASDNLAARGLYNTFGFDTVGFRRAYYRRPNAPAADAIVMRKTLGHAPELPNQAS